MCNNLSLAIIRKEQSVRISVIIVNKKSNTMYYGIYRAYHLDRAYMYRYSIRSFFQHNVTPFWSELHFVMGKCNSNHSILTRRQSVTEILLKVFTIHQDTLFALYVSSHNPQCHCFLSVNEKNTQLADHAPQIGLCAFDFKKAISNQIGLGIRLRWWGQILNCPCCALPGYVHRIHSLPPVVTEYYYRACN